MTQQQQQQQQQFICIPNYKWYYTLKNEKEEKSRYKIKVAKAVNLQILYLMVHFLM